jgi:hypothetical protein
MAGLAAARQLRETRPDLAITIFDKSRGVGGRAATRRMNGAVFDHGAQYLKAPTPELTALIRQTLAHETLVDIGMPVWTFDGANQIAAGDPAQNDEAKWTYRDGLTRLAKELARDLNVRRETRLGRIELAGGGYQLYDDQGAALGSADAVLFTPPAPQTAALIEASALPDVAKTTIRQELAQARYRPCLTLTLGYPATLRERPFYALVNSDRRHPISWLAYEHRKPGRESDDQHMLIAQMAPGWSEQHWSDPEPLLAEQINDMLADLLAEPLPAPRWTNRQGWRYALPDSGADFDTLNSAQPGLFFAGDFTAGQGRLHRAIEEGWRVSRVIAEQLATSQRAD